MRELRSLSFFFFERTAKALPQILLDGRKEKKTLQKVFYKMQPELGHDSNSSSPTLKTEKPPERKPLKQNNHPNNSEN
jgi:hypothetical protein